LRSSCCLETSTAAKIGCHGASNLPNTDSGIFGDVTDAYCKVRVQTETSAASLKLKTKPVDNNLNPRFDATFELEPFEQPLIEPVPMSTSPDLRDLDESEFVPFTIDEMTLSEQLTAHMYNLGTRVFLNSDKCKPANAKVPAFCRLLQGLGSFAVDKSALDEAASTEEDPVTKKIATRLAQTSAQENLAQIAELTGSLMEMVEMTTIRAGRAAAIFGARRRRRRRQGGGRTYRHHGGGSGGAGWIFFAIIIIILIAIFT